MCVGYDSLEERHCFFTEVTGVRKDVARGDERVGVVHQLGDCGDRNVTLCQFCCTAATCCVRANQFILLPYLHFAVIEELDFLVDAAVLTDALDDAVVNATVERLTTLLEILDEVLMQRHGGCNLRLL